MELARLGNKYLADLEPWKLIKSDEKATAFIMRQSCDLLLNLATIMEPFMPEASKRLMKQLGVEDSRTLQQQCWIDNEWLSLTDGHCLNSAELLFQKIEDDIVEAQIQKLNASLIANSTSAFTVGDVNEKLVGSNAAETVISSIEDSPEDIKPLIEFPDFAKIDLRVGTVIACEKVEKADKLLKLTVELGEREPRTIVSGIALHFSPEEVIGNQVVVVANLAPRKMRGIESQGMILMAEDATGKLVFVSPKSMVIAGSGVS